MEDEKPAAASPSPVAPPASATASTSEGGTPRALARKRARTRRTALTAALVTTLAHFALWAWYAATYVDWTAIVSGVATATGAGLVWGVGSAVMPKAKDEPPNLLAKIRQRLAAAPSSPRRTWAAIGWMAAVNVSIGVAGWHAIDPVVCAEGTTVSYKPLGSTVAEATCGSDTHVWLPLGLGVARAQCVIGERRTDLVRRDGQLTCSALTPTPTECDNIAFLEWEPHVHCSDGSSQVVEMEGTTCRGAHDLSWLSAMLTNLRARNAPGTALWPRRVRAGVDGVALQLYDASTEPTTAQPFAHIWVSYAGTAGSRDGRLRVVNAQGRVVGTYVLMRDGGWCAADGGPLRRVLDR